MGIDLARKHADYTATEAERVKGINLYDGERAVHAKGSAYLHQGENESTGDFNNRLARAVLDPYVKKIVTARQAVLFGKSPTRELTGVLKDFELDIDRKGTDAATFFVEAARRAQVAGIHWVAADMPAEPEGGFKSKAEEQAANHRVFMEHVEGAAVIDWEVGDDLALNWAVVHQTHTELRETAGVEPKSKNQWKVWYRDHWVLWEARTNQADKSKVPDPYVVVGEGPNPCNAVPLVPFLGVRHTDFSGWPVAMDVFGHVLAIYNKQSDRDWFERLSAHPIPYFITPKKPVKMDTGKGVWIETAPGVSCDLGYMEPTGSAFASANETIEAYQAKIYRIALAQAQKETAQVQSGDSQREDRKQFTTSLTADSERYEANEHHCWDLAKAWSGDKTSKATAEYNRDFDDAMIDAALISALSSLVDLEILTRKTVAKAVAESGLVDIEDIDKELADAKEQAAERNQANTVAALDRIRNGSADEGPSDED